VHERKQQNCVISSKARNLNLLIIFELQIPRLRDAPLGMTQTIVFVQTLNSCKSSKTNLQLAKKILNRFYSQTQPKPQFSPLPSPSPQTLQFHQNPFFPLHFKILCLYFNKRIVPFATF